MPWPTPWFVGGANHDAEIARLLTFAAFRGQYGVLSPLDCRALETEVPGPNIRIMPGAINVHAKGVGNEYQSYTNALLSQETIAIPPTDSSGPRSDLIIARVEDPNVVGAPWNHDPGTEPVMYTRRIPDVDPTTHHVSQVRPDDSAETICRIDIPGGVGQETGTITNDMIVDLRSIADLSGQRIIIIENPGPQPPPIASEWYSDNKHAMGDSQLLPSHTSFVQFPAEAEWDVPVPAWATGVDVMINYNPQCNAHVWGEARLVMGGTATGIPSPFDDNDTPGGGGYRPTIKVGGTYTIPPSLRGRTVEFRLEGKQFGDDPTFGDELGPLTANYGTMITFFLHFKREPVYN